MNAIIDPAGGVERACERLVLDFARFNDAREFDRVAALFDVDGVFLRPLAPTRPLTGRAAILADLGTKPPDVSTLHVCTNITVDVLSETRAQGLCYFTVYLQRGPVGGVCPAFGGTIHVGLYQDRFVATADGWRIAERRGTIRYSMPAPA